MRTPKLVLAALVLASPLLLPAITAAAAVPTSSEHIITTLYAQPTDSSWSQVESAVPAVSASIADICAADGSGSGGAAPPGGAQPPPPRDTPIPTNPTPRRTPPI
jgi:hypothetical protein